MTYVLLKIESFAIIRNQPVFLNLWSRYCKFFNLLGLDGKRLEFYKTPCRNLVDELRPSEVILLTQSITSSLVNLTFKVILLNLSTVIWLEYR